MKASTTHHRRVSGLRRYIPHMLATVITAAFLPSLPAQAASVFYFLDQSNRLADGTDYLKVTIDDNGAAGAINFTVQSLAPLSGQFCDNFGLLNFGFNGIELNTSNVIGLPDGWKLKNDKKMDDFGKFENVLVGKKWDSQDPFRFSIVGINADSIYSYAMPHDETDGVFFAAFVRSMERDKHGKWRDGKWRDDDDGCRRCIKDVYIGGGEPTPVPVPAAMWLFGSGLIGLYRFAQRKKPNDTPLVACCKTIEASKMENLP